MTGIFIQSCQKLPLSTFETNISHDDVFSDVSRVLSRTRQRSVHVFWFYHVLHRDSNQPVSADQHRHIDDVLYIRHRVRYRCGIPILVFTGNQKQNDKRQYDVILNKI